MALIRLLQSLLKECRCTDSYQGQPQHKDSPAHLSRQPQLRALCGARRAPTRRAQRTHLRRRRAHTYAPQSPLRRACHLRRRCERATGIRCAVHGHTVTCTPSILTKQRQSSRSRRGLAKTAAAAALVAAVAVVVARAAPRAAGWAAAGRRGLCLAHCVRQAAVARAATATAVERRALHRVGYGVGSRVGAGVWRRRLGRRSPDQREQRRSTPRSTPAHHLCRGCAGTDATTRASRRLQ